MLCNPRSKYTEVACTPTVPSVFLSKIFPPQQSERGVGFEVEPSLNAAAPVSCVMCILHGRVCLAAKRLASSPPSEAQTYVDPRERGADNDSFSFKQ